MRGRPERKKGEHPADKYIPFMDHCYEELKIKQNAMVAKYNLCRCDGYCFEQASGMLQFKSNGRVEQTFYVVPAGSWSSKSGAWVWAWANESLDDNFKAASAIIKELAEYTSNEIFITSSFMADEATAIKMAAAAVYHLCAQGMYILNYDDIKLFLLLWHD